MKALFLAGLLAVGGATTPAPAPCQLPQAVEVVCSERVFDAEQRLILECVDRHGRSFTFIAKGSEGA